MEIELSLGTTNFATQIRFIQVFRALQPPLCYPFSEVQPGWISNAQLNKLNKCYTCTTSNLQRAPAINPKHVSIRVTKNSWETVLYLQISVLQFLFPCCSTKITHEATCMQLLKRVIVEPTKLFIPELNIYQLEAISKSGKQNFPQEELPPEALNTKKEIFTQSVSNKAHVAHSHCNPSFLIQLALLQ